VRNTTLQFAHSEFGDGEAFKIWHCFFRLTPGAQGKTQLIRSEPLWRKQWQSFSHLMYDRFCSLAQALIRHVFP
jgi:hypothetical protein